VEGRQILQLYRNDQIMYSFNYKSTMECSQVADEETASRYGG
jgi:hypothetical protein